MINKKSVLMTLNHNFGCFSTVAGIAGNGSRLGEVAEHKTSLGLQMFKLK
jgi:hypothetical protein